MPGRVSSGRRLCASRHLRATILQLFPTSENIAKIPIQGVAAMVTSDRRVGPAIGLTWLPTVSHQAVYDVLRALTDAGLVRRIQPSGSAGGRTLKRYNGANFKI
jgi:hypothetical protein